MSPASRLAGAAGAMSGAAAALLARRLADASLPVRLAVTCAVGAGVAWLVEALVRRGDAVAAPGPR